MALGRSCEGGPEQGGSDGCEGPLQGMIVTITELFWNAGNTIWWDCNHE